jgi:hypothetical protein
LFQKSAMTRALRLVPYPNPRDAATKQRHWFPHGRLMTLVTFAFRH